MNPRKKLEEADPTVARAFVQMFIRAGDQFQFAVDGGVDDEEEVRAYLQAEDHTHGGQSTIGVTAINEKERYDAVKETIQEMGLELLEEDSEVNEHEEIGEYTAYFFRATAPDDFSGADWDVPHMVVYGWLSPELEEVANAKFGHKYEIEDIRNHYVVYGEDVSQDTATTLSTGIQRSNNFFADDQRDYVRSVNTCDII